MRRTLLVLSALLAAGAGPATQPASQPVTQPAHDRDPWVFRCVLDDNPRMLVISLGHHVWAAYDTQHATLAKLWVGDVDFTGAVFDTKHGPQPKARGVMLISSPVTVLSPINQLGSAEAERMAVAFQSYSLQDDLATVRFSAGGFVVDDTLQLVNADTSASRVVVRCTLKVDCPTRSSDSFFGGSGTQLLLPLSSRTLSIRCIDGYEGLQDQPPAASGAVEIPLDSHREAKVRVRVKQPGVYVFETTYDCTPN